MRGLLVTFLLAGLLAGILVPTLMSAQAAPQMAAATHIVISELRFRGSGGASDEFVELFNPTGGVINLNGWKVKGSNNAGATSTRYTFSGNVLLNPGQHFLLANTAYDDAISNPSLAADATYSTGITDDGGVAITLPDETIVDQVGLSGGSAYQEGSTLTSLVTNVDRGYERNLGGASGSCDDTDDNAVNFHLIVSSDPQNLSSPLTYCAGVQTFTPTETPTSTSMPTSTFSPTPITSTPTSTPITPTLTSTAASPLNVIISEVGWAGTIASSSDEWIELYNPTTSPINLNGWTLIAADGSSSITLTNTIPAGGYYLLVHVNSSSLTATATPPSCTVFNSADVTYDQIFTGILSDSGKVLELKDPFGNLVDTANSDGGSWPAGSGAYGTTAYTRHASMERRGVVLDSPSAWITYANSTGTVHDCGSNGGNIVYGTPKQQNWAWGKVQTPTPVPTATTKPKVPTSKPSTPFAHVVINEYLPRAGFDWNNDGVVDVNDEFIEIENNGPIDVNLSNWKLSDDPNIGGKTFTLPGQTLKSGQRVIFYGSTTHILLVDSGDTIRLTNPAGVVMDAQTYGVVKFPDQSHCRIPDGSAYWHPVCFPTPGNENVLTGAVPAAPPAKTNEPAPCLLPDTTPLEFRLAVCSPFGADIWNRKYWDDAAGQNKFVIPDPFSKGEIILE